MTDIGFYSAFQDIEIFYWTVNGTLDGLRDDPYQSTSGTKVGGKCLLDNSRTAQFIKCGNYIPVRINSRSDIVFLREPYEIPAYPGWEKDIVTRLSTKIETYTY